MPALVTDTSAAAALFRFVVSTRLSRSVDSFALIIVWSMLLDSSLRAANPFIGAFDEEV